MLLRLNRPLVIKRYTIWCSNEKAVALPPNPSYVPEDSSANPSAFPESTKGCLPGFLQSLKACVLSDHEEKKILSAAKHLSAGGHTN